MKKLPRYIKEYKKKQKQSFMNTCPVSRGICLNPLCLFGCIEA